MHTRKELFLHGGQYQSILKVLEQARLLKHLNQTGVRGFARDAVGTGEPALHPKFLAESKSPDQCGYKLDALHFCDEQRVDHRRYV
ncbi:hypothetical protein D3C87_1519500 [compost metagenome]